MTTSRPGSRPSARPSSTAWPTPSEWLPTGPGEGGSCSDPVGREDPDRAGAGPAAHRVDHDRELDVGPRVEEAGGIAVAEPDVDRLAETPPGRGRHDPAHAVVAPGRVADADDDDAAGHARWTVRSRKCVAHEMHGS